LYTPFQITWQFSRHVLLPNLKLWVENRFIIEEIHNQKWTHLDSLHCSSHDLLREQSSRTFRISSWTCDEWWQSIILNNRNLTDLKICDVKDVRSMLSFIAENAPQLAILILSPCQRLGYYCHSFNFHDCESVVRCCKKLQRIWLDDYFPTEDAQVSLELQSPENNVVYIRISRYDKRGIELDVAFIACYKLLKFHTKQHWSTDTGCVHELNQLLNHQQDLVDLELMGGVRWPDVRCLLRANPGLINVRLWLVDLQLSDSETMCELEAFFANNNHKLLSVSLTLGDIPTTIFLKMSRKDVKEKMVFCRHFDYVLTWFA
jgi:hypothetical protein